jgi:methylmalonyl-CoA epimerase
MLALHSFEHGQWRPPIVKTEATTGKGIDALLEAIARFQAHSAGAIRQRRQRERAGYRFRELLSSRFVQHVEESVLDSAAMSAVLDRIGNRELDPYTAAEDTFRHALGQSTASSPPTGPVLDHIGIAVADIAEALTFYRDALGLEVEAPEDVASQRVRAHFVPAGGAALELLEATAGDSPIAKYLAKRGAGLHHVTLRVDDLAVALERLKAKGVRLIDDAPRPGAHGSRVAFIHPSSAHGVLVELKEIKL